MIQNYFNNVKRFLGSFISNARAQESWGKYIYLFSFLKIGGSPAKRAMRAGKKKRGLGETLGGIAALRAAIKSRSPDFRQKKFGF